MKLKDVLTKSIDFFRDKKIESPRLEAELLIAFALKMKRMDLYLKYEQPLSEPEIQACRDIIRRRSTGEPVAYITNEKGFFGHNFFVKSGVLIPRPETELIVENAESYFKNQKNENLKFLDLGGGSGCIGLTLLKLFPEATLDVVEFHPPALDCIRENIQRLGVENRVEILAQKVEDVNWSSSAQKYDAIVSNPPYIDQNDPEVQKEVRQFEPHEALFAADQGLALVKSWSKLTVPCLKDKGLMMFEMGYTQGEAVKNHFDALKEFSRIEIVKDLAELDRFVKAVK